MTTALYVPVCNGEDSYMPNPYDCTQYYQCVGDKPILLVCAPGTHFDKSLNVCNWPQMANCTPIPYPE
jgi:hypothetical protein